MNSHVHIDKAISHSYTDSIIHPQWMIMELDFAFICDYAQVIGNKVNALGIGFDTVFSSTIPAIHPQFHLVIQLRTGALESGKKDIEVNLIDADGNNVLPTMKGRIDIVVPKPGQEAKARLAMAFNNVKFPDYGDYSLHVDIEGQEMVRIPLRVASPPPRTKPQSPP